MAERKRSPTMHVRHEGKFSLAVNVRSEEKCQHHRLQSTYEHQKICNFFFLFEGEVQILLTNLQLMSKGIISHHHRHVAVRAAAPRLCSCRHAIAMPRKEDLEVIERGEHFFSTTKTKPNFLNATSFHELTQCYKSSEFYP